MWDLVLYVMYQSLLDYHEVTIEYLAKQYCFKSCMKLLDLFSKSLLYLTQMVEKEYLYFWWESKIGNVRTSKHS